MLEPERSASDANEIEESDAYREADNGGPDFEREIHNPQVEQKGNAVTEQRDKDHEFPVRVDYAEANYRQVDLRTDWPWSHLLYTFRKLRSLLSVASCREDIALVARNYHP